MRGFGVRQSMFGSSLCLEDSASPAARGETQRSRLVPSAWRLPITYYLLPITSSGLIRLCGRFDRAV